MTDATITSLFAIVSDATADLGHRIDAAGLILSRVATSQDHEDAADFLRWVSEQDIANGLKLRALRILREAEAARAKPDDPGDSGERERLCRERDNALRRIGVDPALTPSDPARIYDQIKEDLLGPAETRSLPLAVRQARNTAKEDEGSP